MAAAGEDPDAQQAARPPIRIMRRDPSTPTMPVATPGTSTPASTNANASSSASTSPSSAPSHPSATAESNKPSFASRGNGKDRRDMTMQEREAAYQAARARIFGSASDQSNAPSSSSQPDSPAAGTSVASTAASETPVSPSSHRSNSSGNTVRSRRRPQRTNPAVSNPPSSLLAYGPIPPEWIPPDPGVAGATGAALWSPAGPIPARTPSYDYPYYAAPPFVPAAAGGTASPVPPNPNYLSSGFGQMNLSASPTHPNPLADELDPATTTCRSAWNYSIPLTRPVIPGWGSASPSPLLRPSPQATPSVPYDSNSRARPGRRKDQDASPRPSQNSSRNGSTDRGSATSTPPAAAALGEESFPALGAATRPSKEVGNSPAASTAEPEAAARPAQPSVWARPPAHASLPARPDWVKSALQSQPNPEIKTATRADSNSTPSKKDKEESPAPPVRLLARKPSPVTGDAQQVPTP